MKTAKRLTELEATSLKKMSGVFEQKEKVRVRRVDNEGGEVLGRRGGE